MYLSQKRALSKTNPKIESFFWSNDSLIVNEVGLSNSSSAYLRALFQFRKCPDYSKRRNLFRLEIERIKPFFVQSKLKPKDLFCLLLRVSKYVNFLSYDEMCHGIEYNKKEVVND